jgi:NADH-quinone oxidoreductase subunit N
MSHDAAAIETAPDRIQELDMMQPAYMPDLAATLPEIVLAVAVMALLLLGAFRRGSAADNDIGGSRLLTLLSLGLVGVVLLLVVFSSMRLRGEFFHGMFVIDLMAVFFKVLVLLSSAAILAMSRGYLEREGMARFEYPLLIMFATLGMMVMISASDFLVLYLGLEIQSLALYVIAAINRNNVRAVEAGLKYFILGALASGMLLFGVSLIYGFTGSTDFQAVAGVLQQVEVGSAPGLIVGVVFLISGLAFKLSAVPFHMWTPDVYEGAPTPVTAFFSAAPKLAAMAVFIRILIEPFGGLVGQWQIIIVFIAILSMSLGSFAAIGQNNIKRLMAYSSIGHVGYALIGLAVGSADGVRGVLIYLAIYMFMTVGTFACILAMKRQERMVEEISDLAGLARTNPMMALVLAIFMFSMAGIPPFAGFFGKFYIFLAAVEGGYYLLAVVGVLTSVVGAYYYLRIIKVMYFDAVAQPLDRPVGAGVKLVMTVAAVVVTFFFLYPQPILAGAEAAAAGLFGG